MTTILNYSTSDVVVIRFPFSNLANQKIRPALVVSPRQYNDKFGEILVMQITSRPSDYRPQYAGEKGGKVLGIRGNCTLSFIDCSLTTEEINNILELSPTKTVKKGQIISEILKKKSDSNRWIFKETFVEGEQLSNTLTRLINRLDSKRIQDVTKFCTDAAIGIYLNSEYGQIGFELPTETITLLSKLSLRIEVHILSFGMVEAG